MYAVIFEVEPRPGRERDYLEIAAALRPEVEAIDGFISVERFQSLATTGKLLSLSFWRDADAVKRWREHIEHRAAQAKGRAEIFADYRISVVAVERQYTLTDRKDAPQP
jgi:heme-degrading monooxygenase HmoA